MPAAHLRASFLRVLGFLAILAWGTDWLFFWSLPATERAVIVGTQALLLGAILLLGLRHLGLVRNEDGRLYRRFVLPNVLTLGRILAIPGMVVGALHAGENTRAGLGVGVLFAFASISDLLDGLISRRFARESLMGRILDPLADAMFYSSLSVGLWVRGGFPPWLAVAVLIRFVPGLVVGVWVFTRRGRLEIEPNLLGKASSFVLAIAMATLLLRVLVGPVIPRIVDLSLAGIAALLALVAVVVYLRVGLRALKRLRA